MQSFTVVLYTHTQCSYLKTISFDVSPGIPPNSLSLNVENDVLGKEEPYLKIFHTLT